MTDYDGSDTRRPYEWPYIDDARRNRNGRVELGARQRKTKSFLASLVVIGAVVIVFWKIFWPSD